MFLIIVMFLFSMVIWITFKNVEKRISEDTFDFLLKEVKSFSRNIERYILLKYGNIKVVLEKQPKLRSELDLYLSTYITSDFKNVFLTYYDGKFFRVIGDGSLNPKDRFDFNERFEPTRKDLWLKAIKTKKPIYYKQDIKGVWTTYVYPVLDNDSKVSYLIVIDFSTEPLSYIDSNLIILKKSLFLFISVLLLSVVILSIFLFYDISRQKKMQKLLDRLKELNKTLESRVKEEVEKSREKDRQLIMQSRLALMGELLSMIAHQWRQPLNVIGGVVADMEMDMMLNENNPQKTKRNLETIKKMIKHLSSTIDDFRKFYRKDNEKREVDFDEILQEVLNIASSSLKNKNIKIKNHLKCKQKIKTYPNELKQVLLNLIKNAEDILIERKVDNPKIVIEIFENDDKCIIEVKDNGGGVDEKYKDKIFEPYFTTKNEKNGTGLGLYMSKNIVEQRLGGEILQYNDEEGAVFRIVLSKDAK
ncbi:sensor histidine kinase [Caminibacter pacificus]|uniref:sensor histidine kinase n=1 Tax=Caminibacter pacificus TaxID=1424653 RepID=UPI001474AA1D|nr:HAMP domain-containing sensor histidine kinase [Caminibacter pacificus]